MYACYSQQKSEKRREGKRKTADADVYIYPKRLVVLSAARRVVSRLVRVAVGSDWLARVNKNKHNQNDTRQIHPHRAWNTKTTRKRHEAIRFERLAGGIYAWDQRPGRMKTPLFALFFGASKLPYIGRNGCGSVSVSE